MPARHLFYRTVMLSLYKPDEGVKETIFSVFPLWKLLETLRHDAERICTCKQTLRKTT